MFREETSYARRAIHDDAEHEEYDALMMEQANYAYELQIAADLMITEARDRAYDDYMATHRDVPSPQREEAAAQTACEALERTSMLISRYLWIPVMPRQRS
jgi:hypothetical protein